MSGFSGLKDLRTAARAANKATRKLTEGKVKGETVRCVRTFNNMYGPCLEYVSWRTLKSFSAMVLS